MVGGREGEASARAVAEQWKLDYLDPAAVAVDPRALALIAPADARRLRAVPLAQRGSTTVVAVAAPSEDRFAAVRQLTGPATRFAVISEQTLDALLASRLFAERQKSALAPPAAPLPAPPLPASAPPAAPPAIAPAAVEDGVVDAVVAAVLDRLAPKLEARALDDLDRSRQELRETKAELAAAHAENDQQRRRISALEAELAETRALAEDASARLHEVARLLIATSEEKRVSWS